MIVTSHVCERCQAQFQRPGRKAMRFCSQKCANQHALKLTAEKLKPYAEAGTPVWSGCIDLKVSAKTYREALITFGLHRQWAMRRFKKCAVAA